VLTDSVRESRRSRTGFVTSRWELRPSGADRHRPPAPEQSAGRHCEHRECHRLQEEPASSTGFGDVPIQSLEALDVSQGVVHDDGIDVPGPTLLGDGAQESAYAD
jgi:hypothetical protein